MTAITLKQKIESWKTYGPEKNGPHKKRRESYG